ncbi:hypothetical protein N7465_011425 [Penicillium sp. CMV-2018d]|nr:hypothetical protein N7465_011425 [Penicillium sp. CMV-2018d]
MIPSVPPHSAPPQNLGIPPTFATTFAREVYPASEDCLTLNIWTKPQTGEAKKAVLVWVYGGGYVSATVSTLSDSLAIQPLRSILVSVTFEWNEFVTTLSSSVSFAYTDDPIASGFIAMSATIYSLTALPAEETNNR